jgi:hypothetical protein
MNGLRIRHNSDPSVARAGGCHRFTGRQKVPAPMPPGQARRHWRPHSSPAAAGRPVTAALLSCRTSPTGSGGAGFLAPKGHQPCAIMHHT